MPSGGEMVMAGTTKRAAILGEAGLVTTADPFVINHQDMGNVHNGQYRSSALWAR
jgi:hypothetical protein